jgi:hypothetical protein
VCTLVLAAGASGTARAQGPTAAQVDASVKQLQVRVDQVEKDAALAAQIAQVRGQLDALSRDVGAIKSTLDDRKTVQVPAEAWTAIGRVGALFVVVWGLVSWLREVSRQKEVQLKESAAVKDLARVEKDLAALKEKESKERTHGGGRTGP